ncbi:hypothetical protein EV361DRAFT_942974 [Lentinula raphanica]|uniref:Uncharacterized protein n=1 Tax=Lentinula raphanica TaxID=153919 RepID=A0AA38UN29_9AGAR|nr:hypothetical protein F5878DRAFT_720349 [Lentinula raphanica]KAJ3964024.1 hypothetical protein EV361DRAFT_942974 [Lentinula raphanica]
MDVDSSAQTKDEYLPVETINVDGEAFRICQPNSAQPEGTLTLPEAYRDGVFYVYYQDINRLRRADLVQLCKAYNLGANENMELLRGKLVGFSENLVRWKVIIPGATRAHRGVREGKISKAQPQNKGRDGMLKKKAKAKLSTLRRNDLMGFSSSDQVSVAVVQRSKDMRTLEEKNKMLRLCQEYVQAHPYIPPDERDRRERARVEAKKQASDMAVLNAQFETTNRKLDGLASIVGSMFQGWSMFSPSAPLPTMPPSFLSTPSPSTTATTEPIIAEAVQDAGLAFNSNSNPVLPIATQPAPRASQDSLSLIVAAQHQSLPDPTAVNSAPQKLTGEGPNESASSHGMEFHLKIGHGQVITYTENDLRTPKQVSFAPDIIRLNRVWDDEGPDWDPIDCGNILSLNNIPIAVRYWRDAFSGKKNSKRWKAMKSSWTEWKFVMEEYRSITPAVFWARFPPTNGKQHKWQSIVNTLRAERTARNNELVERAKLEYGEQFDELFSNRKKVLVDPTAIANRYLSLKDSSNSTITE